MDYDFEGWATKNNLRCSDGRVIRQDAFKVNDGKRVPLIWQHQYDSPEKILGHADLTNRPEGVWAQCKFNNTAPAMHMKEALINGDVRSLSICATNLQQMGSDVQHGVIREVSVVLAGANPGAFIESVLTHGIPMEDGDDSAIIYTGEPIIILCHADGGVQVIDGQTIESVSENGDDESVTDVINAMTDKQKKAVAILIDQITGESDETETEETVKIKEEGSTMKHNIFSDGEVSTPVLTHSDVKTLLDDARRIGSLKETVKRHLQANGVLAHALDTTGMTTSTGKQTYGFNDADMLFPDYRDILDKPDFISREMTWVQKVMSGVHHTPFSKVRTIHADITEDAARAKGYIKGKQKKTEVFTLLKRVTSPCTVYKLQKLDRDDIVDITSFDVVAWIKAEMRMMLDEEIARAILIGDGRESDAEDKIKEDCIRPIVHDVALYNVKTAIKAGATSSETAAAIIDGIIRSRKKYKGSGTPTFFTTEDTLSDLLLLKDTNGHYIYKSVNELATVLRVKEIVTVEPMEGEKVEIDKADLPLIGTIVNLADYNVGADKGGQVNMFDDFDIDFNKYTYLIETRCSGALVKPFSALTYGLQTTTSTTPPSQGSGGGTGTTG